MHEERRMILEMLKEGAVTIEEAERLLEAIPAEEETARTEALMAGSSGGNTPKRIYVHVTEDGRTKVNVKVPFSLVRAGLKLGKSFGALGARHAKDQSEADALEMLKEIDIDELLDSLNDGEITLPYTIVDVDNVEDGRLQHVTVLLE